jgi:quercetin dioxygenase-like cupin family protein
MDADPTMIVVTEDACSACGTPRVNVHHQRFPEMVISGESVDEAANRLANQLEADLDAVSDPMHRGPVQHAIADVQAFINSNTVSQAQRSEVFDILAANPVVSEAMPSTLAKTETLEVRRLSLPKGREIPTHHAQGEIVVQCLGGRIAFTAGDLTHEMRAGQLMVLAPKEPHSLVSLEDSLVLVTKVLPARAPAP